MKDKVIEVFKKKGVLGVFAATLNFFLQRLFGIRIVRGNSIASNRVARQVFSKCSLKYSDDGYFFLEPMPSVDELNNYYSSLYWGSRDGKTYGATTRDFVHYNILKEYIPQELVNGKVFLNFGAGHGGISNLCWLGGMSVINIEPSFLPEFYTDRWITPSNITEVGDCSIDVIYGSHSLEHVQDIDSFKKEVSRVLKPGGYLFWEVPNAESDSNGAQKNRVDIPHTYYFKADFFNKWFSEVLLCDGYEQSQRFDVIQNWHKYKDKKGSVVRALGRLV